ncbi:hypothetical protein [Actinomadura sp. 3N508]|uniref:hypothetical protein n=1 Tax=Actinomadura sp. 3N508 TaxID=3375153 RepID=UPI0037998ABD
MEQGRQTYIDVLCAVLRLPYTPDPGEIPADGQDMAAHAETRAAYRKAREVRHTIIRVIGNHLNGHTDVYWRGHYLNFTGVVFDGGDSRSAVFSNACISFHRARFVGGLADIRAARFEGGEVVYRGARFEGGTIVLDLATGRWPFGLPDGMARES